MKEVHIIQIAKILGFFDFETVHKVMVAIDWEYENGIPSVAELRSKAKFLLEQAVLEFPEADQYAIDVDGFRAERNGDDLSLMFIVEQFYLNG